MLTNDNTSVNISSSLEQKYLKITEGDNMENNKKPDAENLLQVCDIYKSFGDNAVLKGMTLSLASGEVLSLIGGNGAGKSTLMKIIMGIYTHDSGKVIVNGKEMTAGKTTEALSSGVYMVPQEPLLFPNMTVEENILIGFTKPQSELHKELVDTMKKIGWNLELNRKANTLSIAEQQLVELLRGLLRHAKILILDEPTSALTFKEVESLFKVVKDLKAQGIGIIYITHRLDEVFEISTDVGIMRDGRITLMGKIEEFTKAALVKGLLPDATDQQEIVNKNTVNYSKDPVLELKNYSGYGFKDISLKVYPGEILGVAGVVGAGPFVAENAMSEEWQKLLRKYGGEYGAATGRPRRVGPFDAVASAYGLKCQNSDLIALTKLDILSYMREIPIITGYKYKNTVVKEFDPTDNIDMYKPVVELMPGWLTDISKYHTYDELPDNARNYIEKLEKLLNHEIQFISVGAERNQYLTKGEWL